MVGGGPRNEWLGLIAATDSRETTLKLLVTASIVIQLAVTNNRVFCCSVCRGERTDEDGAQHSKLSKHLEKKHFGPLKVSCANEGEMPSEQLVAGSAGLPTAAKSRTVLRIHHLAPLSEPKDLVSHASKLSELLFTASFLI